MKSVLFQFFSMICLLSCCSSHGPQTTNTSSTKFNTLSEKVEFLEQYVRFKRTYKTLDFVIVYQNNSEGFVPGPSDWDIRIIAKIPSDEVEQWIKGMEMTDSLDLDWLGVFSITIDKAGISKWYQSDGCIIGVDEKNSIIVYRNWTM